MATHIKIGDVSPRDQYLVKTAQTTFTYSFPIFRDQDLEVYHDDILQTTGFTIAGSGNSAGGEVTFLTAPAAGTVVTLARRLAIERQTDFQESGEFRSKVLNDELDYLTAAVQQVAEDQSRSAHLGVTELVEVDVTLPSPQANATLIWNGSANGFVNGPVADDISNAQGYALSAQSAATQAIVAEGSAVSSASAAANSAQVAATAAASNMYASNAAKSADFTVLPTDDGVQFLIDTTAGPVTITLPEGVTVTDGFRFALAKISADNNAIIVNSIGTDTINAAASWQFSVPHGQSVITVDTTPTPDTWFAAGVGVVAPIGVADLYDSAKPYDIAFVGGFDSTMMAESINNQTYGELVVPRPITVIGEAGYLDVACDGQAVVVDILKNGSSIYATKPQFNIAENTLTGGIVSTPSFAAGDRLTFKVIQTGLTVAGLGLRFTLKAVLA